MSNRVQVSVTGYQQVLKSLDPALAQRAARAGLKRTMERTRTKLTQSISGSKGRYTVAPADVRGKMHVRVPAGGMVGAVRVEGARLNIERFQHRQTAAGVVVRITKHTQRLIKSVFLPKKKGGGLTLFNGKPLAFIRKRADRPNVYHQAPDSRTSTGLDKVQKKRRYRFPIAVVRSLSIPKMVTTAKFNDRTYVARFMADRFQYEFERALVGISILKAKKAGAPPT